MPSRHTQFSVAFITNIAKSNFRYTQVILANISQPPANFVSQIAAYRQRHAERRHDASRLKVAIATHVHVVKDSQTALDEFYPHYSAYFREHAPRANLSGEVPRDVYEKRAGPGGPILVGSPVLSENSIQLRFAS